MGPPSKHFASKHKTKIPNPTKKYQIPQHVSLSLRFAPPPSKHIASKHETKIPNPTTCLSQPPFRTATFKTYCKQAQNKNTKSHNMSLSASVSHRHLQNILQASTKQKYQIPQKNTKSHNMSLSASVSHRHLQNILQASTKQK